MSLWVSDLRLTVPQVFFLVWNVPVLERDTETAGAEFGKTKEGRTSKKKKKKTQNFFSNLCFFSLKQSSSHSDSPPGTRGASLSPDACSRIIYTNPQIMALSRNWGFMMNQMKNLMKFPWRQFFLITGRCHQEKLHFIWSYTHLYADLLFIGNNCYWVVLTWFILI